MLSRPGLHIFLVSTVIALLVVTVGIALWRSFSADPFTTSWPLVAPAGSTDPIELLADDFSLDPLSPGWAERTFWRVKPADYSLLVSEGETALRCTTNDSASILARDTSIDIGRYPILSWQWRVDVPIRSTSDEATPEGDDHPARFFLRFASDDEEQVTAEIIWSNRRYRPGNYKIIDGFHHYVANGLNENIGRWFDQRVDLQQMYEDITGKPDRPILDLLGFFCDSDNAGGSSDATFRGVTLSQR